MEEKQFTEAFNGLLKRIIWEKDHERSWSEIEKTVTVLGKMIEAYLHPQDIPKVVQKLKEFDIEF